MGLYLIITCYGRLNSFHSTVLGMCSNESLFDYLAEYRWWTFIITILGFGNRCVQNYISDKYMSREVNEPLLSNFSEDRKSPDFITDRIFTIEIHFKFTQWLTCCVENNSAISYALCYLLLRIFVRPTPWLISPIQIIDESSRLMNNFWNTGMEFFFFLMYYLRSIL